MSVESLTPMTDAELLEAVKIALNITGAQFDKTLQSYIAEIKEYLKSAGVNADVVSSTLSVGCISRGVADLWNYGNGDTKLSEYFYQRAEQLRAIEYTPVPPAPVYTEAKIIINVTDESTGEVVEGYTCSVTGAEKAEDGYYYIEASEKEWTGLITCTGYKMKRFYFVVTEADVSVGQKDISVTLTPNA